VLSTLNVQFVREQEMFSYVNVQLQHVNKQLLELVLSLNLQVDDGVLLDEYDLVVLLLIVQQLK
jgi:hypothetical protein